MPTIRIGARQVCRAFGPVVANDRVDLAVAPGSIHAVIGENGAGKTTLMRILYGLDQPDDGTLVEAVDARYLGTFYDYRIDLVRTPMAHDSESVTGVRP